MEERKQKKRKRRRIILISLFSVLLILYIIGANILVDAALVPSFMRKLDAFQDITDKSYAEQVQTDDIKEHRKASLSDTEKWVQSTPKEKRINYTADGYKLAATEFLRDDDSHKWVLVLHGYTGWKEEMYEFAFRYHEHGYHVIVPDMRCQGESEGDFIGMGYTDSRDNLIYLNYILECDPEAEIVLHGQSMGASAALIMSGMEELPEAVKAIVSDSAYTDGYTMFGDKVREWGHLPAWTILDAANLMLMIRGGYNLRKADALEAVSKTSVPVLLIHGDEDAMINVSMAYRLYEAAGTKGPLSESYKKELLIVEGAGHGQTQDKDPGLYYGTVFDFLGQVLGEP